MELYESIKNVAKSRGCTIAKMKKDLGLGKSVVSKFDEHAPSIEKIVKIADYFDVSIDTLIGRRTSTRITEDELLLLTFNHHKILLIGNTALRLKKFAIVTYL